MQCDSPIRIDFRRRRSGRARVLLVSALGLGALLVGCASRGVPTRAAGDGIAPQTATLLASGSDVAAEHERAARERAYRDALARLRAEREPAPDRNAPPTPAVLAARAKGWGWLVDQVTSHGIPRERVARAFADDRMPPFDGLYFGLDPRESRALYRHFLRRDSIARAQRCASAHARSLEDAQRVHGVDGSVLAAILHVETACGRNTGRSIVLHRLARLAMANEPHNVARNLSRNTPKSGVIEPEIAERVRARARYLEGIFYPQVVATFEIAAQNDIDPLDIRGSSAGAFGYPQFLPLNYIAFGTDGNGDGKVSLYDPDDAIASAARFLSSYGWKPRMTEAGRRAMIWHYNRSDAYIDAVLGLADRIRSARTIESAIAGASSGGFLAPTAGSGVELDAPLVQHP
jgi:membrane-bound lytic murein transglycosylase B